MIRYKICLLYKNFWSYDPVVPVPSNLPPNIDTIYVTDNLNMALCAKNLYWTKTYVIDTHITITDAFERRKIIAYINCFPEKFVPELNIYDYVMICDSNVIKLDTNYSEFIKGIENQTLCITSGWYRGPHNNIVAELHRSLNQPRWRYNFDKIKQWCDIFFPQLVYLGIDPNVCPVVSAKYIGWNIHHSKKNEIAQWVYDQYMIHLQGNIIFSVADKLFPRDIYHYKNFLNDGELSGQHLSY